MTCSVYLPAKLQVVNTLAHAPSPWLASDEEVGDTEVVHELAPDAAIREVLIPSPYVARLSRVSPAVVAALRLGLTQGGIVSLRGGTGEQCFTPWSAPQAQAPSRQRRNRAERPRHGLAQHDSNPVRGRSARESGSSTAAWASVLPLDLTRSRSRLRPQTLSTIGPPRGVAACSIDGA
jgi:hypothetical protein